MSRPNSKSKWSLPEKILQPLGAGLLLTQFAFTAAVWGRLPARIPTHFGALGTADSWGGKSTLLLVPVLTIALYAGLTLLERFPQISNYPVEITEKNATVLYGLMRELNVVLKTLVVLIFSYIQFQTVETARNAHLGLGIWFLPASLTALFGFLGLYIYRMVRHKKG